MPLHYINDNWLRMKHSDKFNLCDINNNDVNRNNHNNNNKPSKAFYFLVWKFEKLVDPLIENAWHATCRRTVTVATIILVPSLLCFS